MTRIQPSPRCILSKFYIKPQLRIAHGDAGSCCILSKFYIKPQLLLDVALVPYVVSYRNSTSNHNSTGTDIIGVWLYLIEILHQTTTYPCHAFFVVCCILSKFYIKPQPHDAHGKPISRCILSKFYIKPQRSGAVPQLRRCCILSKFYIKPQRLIQN